MKIKITLNFDKNVAFRGKDHWVEAEEILRACSELIGNAQRHKTGSYTVDDKNGKECGTMVVSI